MAFKYSNGRFGALERENPLINSVYSQDFSGDGSPTPPPEGDFMVTEIENDFMITEDTGDFMVTQS